MGANHTKDEAEREFTGPDLLLEASSSWGAYQNLFTGAAALYLIALLLLVLKESFLRRLTDKVPESLVLILIGVSVGAVLYFTDVNTGLKNIDDKHIMNFLLPPIILDSAYHLYSRQLLYELDGVLVFAVFGTMFSIVTVGPSLYGAYGKDHDLGLLECLLFAAIVSAVDPVAVLAVFNKIGVASPLYVLIFGESLFNDGITVVFFEGLEKLSRAKTIDATVYAYAFLSFFTVSLGGLLIGFVMAILSALACRCTSLRSRMLEPLIILLSAYFAFLSAQILHWSGFLAIISCGLAQKRYAFPNLFEKSRVTVIEGAETAACLSETLIFLLLGVDSYFDKGWDPAFIGWTILFITVYRVVGIFLLSTLINTYRLHVLTYKHMFVMAYGGLRGAVSYVLAASLEKNSALFVTSTLAVIFFTVFVQGGTVRLLVLCFHFTEGKNEPNFTSLVSDRVVFHSLAGIEAVMGGAGTRIHYWLERLEQIDKRYFRRFVVIPARDLSGVSDFIHHKELHAIFRKHSFQRTRNEGGEIGGEDADNFSSETAFSSSGPMESSYSTSTADGVLPRKSHRYLGRIRRKLQAMTPSRRKREKARKLASYKKNLLHDQRLARSKTYRKHPPSSRLSPTAQRRREFARRRLFEQQQKLLRRKRRD